MTIRALLSRLHMTAPALGYKGYGYCLECCKTFDRPLIMRAPLRHRFHEFVTSRPSDVEELEELFHVDD